MRKYLVTLCAVLGVAILGGFAYTLHFTITNFNNPNNKQHQELQSHAATLQSAISVAHSEIENQHARIRELQAMLDFYHAVLVEIMDIFDANTDLFHELLGEINDYRDLVGELNSQIDTLQNLVTDHEKTIEILEAQVDNLQRELDFWLEAGIDNAELLQELIAQNTALLAQVATLDNSLQILQSDFNDLFASFNALTNAANELIQENIDLNELIGELQNLINELNEKVEYYKNRLPQVEYYYSNVGRTKNFVDPINIMETENEVFLWQHFDTQIFLDMLLWEWGNPFFGPTLVGYYVAFEFTVQTSGGSFEYAIEIIHDAGFNPMARAFKDGVLVPHGTPPIFNITLTPVTFSYKFTPLPAEVEITAVHLERLTFFHLAPWLGGGA